VDEKWTSVSPWLLDGTERTVELYEETGRQGWKLGRTASPGKLGAFEAGAYTRPLISST
jgi:DNA mismatch repair protein MSH2